MGSASTSLDILIVSAALDTLLTQIQMNVLIKMSVWWTMVDVITSVSTHQVTELAGLYIFIDKYNHLKLPAVLKE